MRKGSCRGMGSESGSGGRVGRFERASGTVGHGQEPGPELDEVRRRAAVVAHQLREPGAVGGEAHRRQRGAVVRRAVPVHPAGVPLRPEPTQSWLDDHREVERGPPAARTHRGIGEGRLDVGPREAAARDGIPCHDRVDLRVDPLDQVGGDALDQGLLAREVMEEAALRDARRLGDGLERLVRLLQQVTGPGEAQIEEPTAYEHFNAFFTRALKPGARTPDPDPRSLLMPADGHISQCGPIESGRIFQAKGQSFTVEELLGDAASTKPYADGLFATVYLSPRDYHRVHMPYTGRLVETVHVPGRLFSVGTDAVASVPRLFARNERLVCHFETEFGPMVQVMIGALLVSGVETVWSGVEIPPYGDRITRKDWRGRDITLDKFAEMARFNYGSTVIVLLPPGVAKLAANLYAEGPVKLGQCLATLRGEFRRG